MSDGRPDVSTFTLTDETLAAAWRSACVRVAETGADVRVLLEGAAANLDAWRTCDRTGREDYVEADEA